jgi:alanine racemase
MNAYSISTQMKRYGISKEEAEEKIRLIKQSNSSTLESKIRKGMDPEEAQQKVTEEKRKNSENTIKGQQKFKEENLKGWKAMSRSNPEYWIIHKNPKQVINQCINFLNS